MTNSGGDPGRKVFIAGGRGVLSAPFLLQLNHIFAVWAELLTAIGGDPLPALLFEGRGESLGLFSCALFRPGGGYIKGGRPGLELLTVRPTATVDTDGVADQFAGLVPAFLDVSHTIPPNSLSSDD